MTPKFSFPEADNNTRVDSDSDDRNEKTLAPTVVVIMDVGCIGPVRPKKWMLALVGMRLRELGYC